MDKVSSSTGGEGGGFSKLQGQSTAGLATTECVEIKEGKAAILFPSQNEVFYNPVQEFNRDLSVAVIQHFAKALWTPARGWKKKGPHHKKTGMTEECKGTKRCSVVDKREEAKQESVDARSPSVDTAMETNESPAKSSEYGPAKGIKILEALSASGLRSLRYALEIEGVEEVVANDYSWAAFESIQRNTQYNKLSHLVRPQCEDASMLMYMHRSPPDRMDVVDLDPYGSASEFLDPAVQAVDDGGLLCVTCTDMAVLCGNHPEACHAKYGSMPLKADYCHEMALRILLASIESHANRYQRYTRPLLSCSIDFYIRVFVQVFTSAAEVKQSPSKLAMVYHCLGCSNFHLQPVGRINQDGHKRVYTNAVGPPVGTTCDNCGYKFKFGGPFWRNPIHSTDFVGGLLEQVKLTKDKYGTHDRMVGLLTVVQEELQDIPLYHRVDDMCGTLHCDMPSMLALRSAILDQGYHVSISHCNAAAVKTDAPHEVIWDILRCWVKDHPVKNASQKSPGAAILAKEPRVKANFEIRKDANPPSRLRKLARFPEKPLANWGPKAKAGRKEDTLLKRKEMQGKRRAGTVDLKQYSCKRFAKGQCELGNDCRYSHDIPLPVPMPVEETKEEETPLGGVEED